jgi:hypothetical protein
MGHRFLSNRPISESGLGRVKTGLSLLGKVIAARGIGPDGSKFIKVDQSRFKHSLHEISLAATRRHRHRPRPSWAAELNRSRESEAPFVRRVLGYNAEQ